MTVAKIAFTATLAFACGVVAFAQERTVTLPGVTLTAVDRAGEFYAIAGNSIFKFDSLGNRLDSVVADAPITLFDPGNGVRLLAYFRDTKEDAIYTPTRDEWQRLPIDPSWAISPCFIVA